MNSEQLYAAVNDIPRFAVAVQKENMMNRRPTKRKSNNTTLTLALILAIAIIANIFIYGTVISDRTPADTVNLRKVPLLEETEEAEKKPENLIPQN